MSNIGNPDTQREQAALRASGFNLRLDGIRGEKTIEARNQFAIDRGIDPNDTAKVRAALEAKLADPDLRDNILRIRIAGPNPSRDDVAMAQWMLKAGNRDMSKSVDPITGMMDGRRGTDTNDAIAENRRRQPTMAELKEHMSADNYEWARKKVEGVLTRDFKTAMQDSTPLAADRAAQVDADIKARIEAGRTAVAAKTPGTAEPPRTVAKLEMPEP